ncbi:uncharacterized protein SPPG_09447 [Spizellomyces punctatus DAOM BR117]|uniref:Anaphase-promoting complex subunit 4 WD40 domain-containing protein n=1 Tax=Spizellomyces punctatus (strain DAOM BR117) TaxID=645134 RepID=A0A0L0H9J8_SPIPD|nr:uncharacterized protein SPPG_09447 [Spizellomyces punctatus DAOM BR117]KNC97691.1 hypothetical protein SPPG_09447 [Spizellomyces punctatus DAOM BR117]|eukprot:XP_016605731.1 hypothetical protein SPPG_09447 [Spizellomyces punctatus DAOM BR117]
MTASNLNVDLRYPTSSGPLYKVRWSPTGDPNTIYFATGTFQSKTPQLQTYACRLPTVFETDHDEPSRRKFTLDLVTSLPHPSHVTDICWLPDGQTLVTGGNNGIVYVHRGKNGMLKTVNETKLHRRNCVGVAAITRNDVEIASVGKDGELIVSTLNGEKIHEIPNADCLEITGVQWRTVNEIVISGSSGHLTLFDCRQKPPGRLLADQSPTPVRLNCLAVSPTLHGKITTGDRLGNVAIWDLRNLSKPGLSKAAAHSAAVWDVRFHPDRPGEVISCAEDSTICFTQWNSSVPDYFPEVTTTASLRRMQGPTSLPFNSIDCHPEHNVLVGVGDAGTIFLKQT